MLKNSNTFSFQNEKQTAEKWQRSHRKKEEKMDKATKNTVMYNSLFRCYVDDFALPLSLGNYKTRTELAIDLIIDILFHFQE